jgi:hypothetical protein
VKGCDIRRLDPQRDKNQRAADEQVFREADRIRAGLTSSDDKRRNSR